MQVLQLPRLLLLLLLLLLPFTLSLM